MNKNSYISIAARRVSKPQASSRGWIAAFVGVFIVTVLLCSFYEGQAKQMGHEASHIQSAVAAAKAKADEERARAEQWRHRYEVLADSAGEVAVIEASIREQGDRQ